MKEEGRGRKKEGKERKRKREKGGGKEGREKEGKGGNRWSCVVQQFHHYYDYIHHLTID